MSASPAAACPAAPPVVRPEAPVARANAPQIVVGVPLPGKTSCADEGVETEPDPKSIEAIEPDRAVPPFAVTTIDCRRVDSRDLVGKTPFVLVFFASWCHVCERKMPLIHAAAAALGSEVPFIGVSVDENETWGNVSGFVSRHGLSFPLVRGARFKDFALAYNPVGGVPVVVVVGKDGVLVDMQVGYTPFDYNRLVGAVRIAKEPESHDPSMPERVSQNPTRVLP